MEARVSDRIERSRRPRIESLESRHLLTVFQFGATAPLDAQGPVPAVPTVSNQSGSVTVQIGTLTDAQGNAMDAGYSGLEFGEGRMLKYQTLIGPMTGNSAVTSLNLSGPGIMILKSGIGSSGSSNLYVLGSNPKRSVLTGTLDGTDGWNVVSPNGVKDRAQPWA
jgi:hypothetical protein